MTENISERALKIATTQVGVREIGNTNSGKEVDQYLKSVGLPGGYSWCMAFVYWCYQSAATALNVKNPLVKTAGVINEWNTIDENNKVAPADAIANNQLITPGSIFIVDHGGGKGHTGMVERIYGGFINTIEGNTNDDGSREGFEVCRRTRKIVTLKGFIVFKTVIHI